MRFFSLFIIGMFYLTGSQLSATIINTKHNLSVNSTAGTIKAQAEQEVCVFCHIPHQARPDGKPLWNRSMPASTYTMYNSDYLKRMGYSVEADLGSTNDTPGALSRQCLSCHDGTVAVGAVFKLRRNFIDGTPITMDGVAGDGTIPTTSAGFIGTDLTMHHPVGIKYDPTITKNFGIGTKPMELKVVPDSPIKLYTYSGYADKYVECSSCHNPHKDNDRFLHVDSGTNFAQNISTTCTSCHEKTDWTGSIHQNPPIDALYTDVNTIAKYGTDKMSDLGCANCHMPHNAEGVPYITRKVQGNTCFVGAAADGTSASCHGTGGYKDIESVLNKTYAHPVIIGSDGTNPQHTNLDTLYGTGITDPDGGEGISWDTNKHAVCTDCHNPHKAGTGTHVTDGSWYGSTTASPTNNDVSPVLQGVAGVEPTWPASWTQPTTFTTLESSTKEYQICFKCHSYWGLGSAANGINDAGHTSISNIGQPLTDVAYSMNINNKSGHPVIIDQNSRPGSYAPKAIPASSLLPPWDSNPGANVMYCSDCHGANDEQGVDPKGPHGSDRKFLLKGINQYWPTNPLGGLYSTADINKPEGADLFCKNCHNLDFPHKNWGSIMSFTDYSCVSCHVAVPHGSDVSRLIGYNTFPSPYNYGGNSLRIERYKKNNGIVDENNVAGGGCGGGMWCHGGNTVPGYDANPMP